MPTATADPAPKDKRVTRRLLRSPLVDLLLGPHGVDRYLELISPKLTMSDARAEIVDVRRQTARSVTLRLAPNGAWQGARAGQFVRVGIEIDGVRRTRTYSPCCSERAGTRELELTVTEHPGGLVSEHLLRDARPGTIVHLGPAQGDFVLPVLRPRRLTLISGGSGITPVLAMLRTLCEERHDGELRFVHYARTRADWLYRSEVTALAAADRRRIADYRYTRGSGCAGRLDETVFGPDALDDTCWAAVCGPASLVEAARTAWEARGGVAAQLLTETFEPPTLALSGDAAEGTLRLLGSDRRVAIVPGTLLEQAEAAGLTPDFGCRMGICRTCTCRKAAGTVRNALTGELSSEEDEDIQLCISVPVGDVALQL